MIRTIIRLTLLILNVSFYSYCSILTTYQFQNDPIDVVIPCTAKDWKTLDLCIAGIRKNANIRRVIVISSEKMTNHAEWFNEGEFPFAKWDVAFWLADRNKENAIKCYEQSRIGWYYQQLLKLYAPFVIPNISSNVLILDADTIFFKAVDFLNEEGGGLYNTGEENRKPYFKHGAKLIPKFQRLFPEHSGICHHMLFQRCVLEDLFLTVEEHHHLQFWQAFCACVDPQYLFEGSGASEYEIYFNFVFSKTSQVSIRQLKWLNSPHLDQIEKLKNQGYHYASFHAHMRE